MNLDSFGWSDTGAGRAVVLLHSSGASRRQWRRLEEALAPSRRVMSLDLYGYGETPLPAKGGDFRLEDEAELLRLLLEHAGEPADLIGHSYGGAVALKAALLYPETVRSVLAHEPVLFRLLERAGLPEWNAIDLLGERVRSAVRQGRHAVAVEAFVNYWNGDGAWARMPPERQQALAAAAPKADLDFNALFSDESRLTDYGALTIPRRLTVGELTPAPAARVCGLFADVWGAERVRVLKRAGHMAPITHPDLFNAQALEFLGVETSSAA